jgi:glutathione synthase/RimK-type ligase-like ATP-grasp enzyme
MTVRTEPAAACWGVFRELEHSPGREADDAGILEATGRRLGEEGAGFDVAYRSPDSLGRAGEALPSLVFSMCEGREALERVSQWESLGVCVVNSAGSVANTHRERMMPLLAERRVPTPESRLLDGEGTIPRGAAEDRLYSACWVKQATEHKTREGDVVFATDPSAVVAALERLQSLGLPRAVVQRHVEGDLVKFYGVGGGPRMADARSSEAGWFRWFYPKEKPVSGHPFDESVLREIAGRATDALGLEVWGGDAIVTPAGEILVIDVNAWPSFALFRDEAADHIAAHLAARLGRRIRMAV